MMKRISKQGSFSAFITKGEIAWVSYCPELGVTSQGESEENALENLREAVGLYLEDDSSK